MFDEIRIDQNKIISIENIDNNENSIFIADPFYIEVNDSIYIFVEHQKLHENATIDLFVLSDIELSYRGTILNPKHHISYPQVFKYQEDYYMLPETKRANNVLYIKR